MTTDSYDDDFDDSGDEGAPPARPGALALRGSSSLFRPAAPDELSTLLGPARATLELRPTLLGALFPSHARRAAVKQAKAVQAITEAVRATVKAVDDINTSKEESATRQQGEQLQRDAQRRLHLDRVAADVARLEAERAEAQTRTAEAQARTEEARARASAARGQRDAASTPYNLASVAAAPAAAPPPSWDGKDDVSRAARKAVTLAATMADSDWIDDPVIAFAASAYLGYLLGGAPDQDARRSAFADLVALGADSGLSHGDLARLNASRTAKARELRKRAESGSLVGTLATNIRGEE